MVDEFVKKVRPGQTNKSIKGSRRHGKKNENQFRVENLVFSTSTATLREYNRVRLTYT